MATLNCIYIFFRKRSTMIKISTFLPHSKINACISIFSPFRLDMVFAMEKLESRDYHITRTRSSTDLDRLSQRIAQVTGESACSIVFTIFIDRHQKNKESHLDLLKFENIIIEDYLGLQNSTEDNPTCNIKTKTSLLSSATSRNC